MREAALPENSIVFMAVRAYAPINYYTNERFTDEVELRIVVRVPFMRCPLASLLLTLPRLR